jgi:hypothetical protein
MAKNHRNFYVYQGISMQKHTKKSHSENPEPFICPAICHPASGCISQVSQILSQDLHLPGQLQG